MTFRVRPAVEFLSKENLEAAADALLDRFENECYPLDSPPVPVQSIAEDLLGFQISWWNFQEPETVASINPNLMEIGMNEERSDYFDHVGQGFTLAHEIGHWVLNHFFDDAKQLDLRLYGQPDRFLHRENDHGPYGSHEFQAEFFASCLVMPTRLLRPTTADLNLLKWPNLYKLRDKFHVSITAMTKRLQYLGMIYVKDGELYRNEQEANGTHPLF